ncbi:histidine phosphatase family protein [Nicoliella spurrieriana]|uniref:Histidine phosphatase family protein n=1 Tax=Nicoliella spurrieriana TaxID=2925830 RepID=A0A976RRJ8_9LACO|nr:histidine phosphatase family protein [Nicoliella spurrieriana]UQS86316.1 histidine phosphatase family protein [Nicoliella spurrieriana]
MPTVNIYFVRHGQTYLNFYNRIQGLIDAPLTDQGIKDADQAGERLKSVVFDAAYSSDLPRAANTGRHILAKNPTSIKEPILDPAFREVNFGYFEGNDSGQAWHFIGGPKGLNDFGAMLKKLGMGGSATLIRKADPYQEAEDDDMIRQRFQPGLDRILAAAKDGDNILVTAHGCIIRWITEQYSDYDISVPIYNGSVTKMVVTDHQPTIESYNQID